MFSNWTAASRGGGGGSRRPRPRPRKPRPSLGPAPAGAGASARWEDKATTRATTQRRSTLCSPLCDLASNHSLPFCPPASSCPQISQEQERSPEGTGGHETPAGDRVLGQQPGGRGSQTWGEIKRLGDKGREKRAVKRKSVFICLMIEYGERYRGRGEKSQHFFPPHRLGLICPPVNRIISLTTHRAGMSLQASPVRAPSQVGGWTQ